MDYIELFTDAALKLKKLFKNDEHYTTALFSLSNYLRHYLEHYEYEDEEHEQEELEALANKWFDAIEKLKKAKFPDEDILMVLVATNEMLRSEGKYEEDNDDENDDYEYYDDDDFGDEEEDNMNYKKK